TDMRRDRASMIAPLFFSGRPRYSPRFFRQFKLAAISPSGCGTIWRATGRIADTPTVNPMEILMNLALKKGRARAAAGLLSGALVLSFLGSAGAAEAPASFAD